MLQEFPEGNVLLSINASGYFQQDRAPPHLSLLVWNYLDATFLCWWMGKRLPSGLACEIA
jgi:hypothetical protein